MFKIRRIQATDFPSLIELFTEFAHFEKVPEKMNNTVSRMTDEKEYVRGFVAIDEEDRIIGYSTCFFTYHTWTGKGMYMDDLYVKEENRKQGIGKSLIESVIQDAKDNNCHRLSWQVTNWNTPAQEFYKSMGAVIQETEFNCIIYLK